MSLPPRWLLSAVRAGCLLLILAAPAGASELSWDGPSECAQAEQLLVLIEGALGMPLGRAGQLEFQVRVDRALAPARARARLSVTSPEPGAGVKQRVLVAASCAKLVDTLAVAISLILGATESAAAATPAAAAKSVVMPEAAASWDIVPSVDTRVLPAAAEAGSAPEPSALAFVVADIGSLPSPALGAAVGLELAWSRVQLRALGTLFFEQQARVEAPRSGPGGELNFAYATLQACARPAATLVASLCAGLDAGRMSGVGTGVARAWQASVLWLAPRLDAGFSWHIPETQLRLGAFLGGAVPLNRDRFILNALGTVHRPGVVAGHAGLGVNLVFE